MTYVSEKHGLKVNSMKTKVMIISRDNRRYEDASLAVDGSNLQRVFQYKFLGNWLRQKWDHDEEKRCRIKMA